MASIFVLIEMAESELIGVHLFQSRGEAQSAFNAICAENEAEPEDDLSNELPHTLAFAGDDLWSVQILERGVV